MQEQCRNYASPELAPLFAFLLFWGSLCFPLTRQKSVCVFGWGPNSSQECRNNAGVPFFGVGHVFGVISKTKPQVAAPSHPVP